MLIITSVYSEEQMPTYEYECNGPSAHRFEKFQKFSDPPVQECPVCSTPVRRVIYPAGVIFKGPGFFRTDNRTKAASTASEDGAVSNGKTSDAAEPKPEKSEAVAGVDD